MFRPIHRLPLVALLLSTVLAPAAARAERWTSLGPDGGTVRALAADPGVPGTLYAGTDGGGVWKSTDGGGRWRSASEGLGAPDVYDLAISPQVPGTLWAATGGGIYKSTDGGAHWHRVWFEAERPDDTFTPWTLSIAADPMNPQVAWAATARSWILKTIDGGASWERVLESPARVGLILIDPTDSDTVYTGLLKTTDGGATWQALDSHGSLLALAPSNPRILYADGGFEGFWKSLDGGATWIHLPGFQYGLDSFLVDPSDPDVLLAAHSGVGLFRSEDGGQSWRQIQQGLPYFRILALAADPTQPGRVWFGANERGVFRSLDSGRTWQASRTGLSATHTKAVAFDPVRPRTLYAVAEALGTHRSTDAGRTWTRINAGLPTSEGYGVSANTVAADPTHPGVLFAGTGGGIYRSLDRGARWAAVGIFVFAGDVHSLAFDPARPGTVFSGGDALVRSGNGGRSWKRLPLPATDYDSEIAEVIVAPLRPRTVFVLDINERRGSARSLFRSPDSGTTWSLVFDAGPAALALHPADPDIAWLATEGTPEIWQSSDGGRTWEPVATGVGGGAELTALLVDRLDPAILYLGTDGTGVWRSTDRGVTWAPLGTGLAGPRITCLQIDPRIPRRLLACTWGGGLQEIRLSSTP